MHNCKENNCSNPVFGGERCKYHQWLRKRKGGDLYAPKPRLRPSIPKESSKRKEEKKYYTQHCAELTQEIKDTNGDKIYCFFSGIEIIGKPVYHHLRGRTGDYYVDKEWLVPAINQYHLMYHFMSVEQLMQESWYPDFLARLKAKNEALYWKERKKEEKSNELF